MIIAHDNVYKRMSVGGAITMLKQNYAPYPKAALPVVSFSQSATFHLNGDDVVSTHLPPAHTDGDSFVRFPKANVIHTGDVFASYRYPFIDPESGGSVKGVLRAIDAKPLAEFDAEWGKFRKTDAFVEIVYSGLAPKKK